MSKEYLEALEKIKNFLGYNYCSVDLPNELKLVEQALQRLESIDNANPSEALECLNKIVESFNETTTGMYGLGEVVVANDLIYGFEKELNTIKQALLKAQKEHNSVNLLMQELDCKDFAELRKYARCGYEKLNKKDLHLERVEE